MAVTRGTSGCDGCHIPKLRSYRRLEFLRVRSMSRERQRKDYLIAFANSCISFRRVAPQLSDVFVDQMQVEVIHGRDLS